MGSDGMNDENDEMTGSWYSITLFTLHTY